MRIPFVSNEIPQQKVVDNEHEKRNFRLALLNGVFSRIGFRFVDSGMVLSAFVKELTNSNVMVGLVSSTMRAGWMWPQLLISNLLEHRSRKMPFYIFGIAVRTFSWMLIVFMTLLIGARNYILLFVCFYSLYFIGCSSMGISTLPFNDILAKSVPVRRRARLFSLRQFIGGIFGIGVGFLVRYILSDKFYLSFPYNYATIFSLSTLMMVAGSISFMYAKEPVHPVRDERRPFWQHLKRGPYFLRRDRDYRYFLIFRAIAAFGSMCTPFYVPYALDRMGISESTIGSFIAVGAVSALFSNILWVYVGEKYGSKSLLVITQFLACLTPLIAASARYFSPSHQITYYFLVFIVDQSYMSGSNIAYMTYSLNLAPSMSRPTYLGFLNTLIFPLSFVPLLSGMMLNVMPYEWMFIIASSMAGLAVYFAVNLSNVDERDDIESKDE